MSDSIFGKEDIGFRKKRVPETSQGVAIPSIIRFAHKFAGGEASFSLLNMTTPTSEMPGFVNPSPSVIAGAGIAANSSALRLYISSGGRMIEFDSYKVLGTTIQFLGVLALSGMPANTVVYGEIAGVAANPIVVGDGRFIRKSYSLAVGATSCPLGLTYKVGVGLGNSDQIGDIMVFRNGVLQMRNVGNATAAVNADGNYQEIDAGNGYGTSITFNTPPVGQADAIMVQMGFQVASGQMQIWSELERLQGAIQALAVDAALGFGQPIGNYLSANATELERRAFGDLVTSYGTRLNSLNDGFLVAAIKNSSQVIAHNTNSIITGWTATEDSSAGGFNASTGVYTCNNPGRFVLLGQITWPVNSTSTRTLRVALNGADASYTEAPGNATVPTSNHVQWAGRLSSGNTLALTVVQLSGGNLTLPADGNYQKFTLMRVGN